MAVRRGYTTALVPQAETYAMMLAGLGLRLQDAPPQPARLEAFRDPVGC